MPSQWRSFDPCRPTLRLVCCRFRALVDSTLCPCLRIDCASHLAGGRPIGTVIYPSRSDFLAAAARVMEQRAGEQQHQGRASYQPVPVSGSVSSLPSSVRC